MRSLPIVVGCAVVLIVLPLWGKYLPDLARGLTLLGACSLIVWGMYLLRLDQRAGEPRQEKHSPVSEEIRVADRQRVALMLVQLALRVKDTDGLRRAERELLELIAEDAQRQDGMLPAEEAVREAPRREA